MRRMTTVRRRISMNEMPAMGNVTFGPSKSDTEQMASMFAKLASGLGSLADLTARVGELEKAHKMMMSMCDSIQKSLGKIDVVAKQLSTYAAEHAELHRNMAKERGATVDDLVKLVRNTVGQMTTIQDTVGGALT